MVVKRNILLFSLTYLLDINSILYMHILSFTETFFDRKKSRPKYFLIPTKMLPPQNGLTKTLNVFSSRFILFISGIELLLLFKENSAPHNCGSEKIPMSC